jgi:hypothetical protein
MRFATDDGRIASWRRILRDDLDLLARDGDAQVAWLVANRCPATELAEQLRDTYAVVRQPVNGRAYVPGPVLQAVEALLDLIQGHNDAFLAANREFWSDDAVRALPQWNEVRASARAL